MTAVRTAEGVVAASLGERAAQARRVHGLLLQEYGHHVWRSRREPLAELVQTILSQHTSDRNSHQAFADLVRTYPTWEEVRDAPPDALAATIRSAGLGNIKAARIQQALREISANGKLSLDFLAGMTLPAAKAWLRSLPGVGPKTAACVLLFSLGKPALPVDTHVYRVSRRLGLIESRTTADQAHDILEGLLPADAIYDFHVNLVAHGRQVCHAQRPRCEDCVLQLECHYFLGGMARPSPMP